MARANPHWRAFQGEAEVLAMFQGPHAYISSSWYATPAAVPTWNYASVHAYGHASVIDDAAAVRVLLEDTVRTYEASFDTPLSLERLDDALIDQLMKNIVAFEIPINRLEGKLKFNQNRSAADRAGVIAALRGSSDAPSVEVADLMQALERGGL